MPVYFLLRAEGLVTVTAREEPTFSPPAPAARGQLPAPEAPHSPDKDGSRVDRGVRGAGWILPTCDINFKRGNIYAGSPRRMADLQGCPVYSGWNHAYSWQTSCRGSFTWEVISALPASCTHSLNLLVRATGGEKKSSLHCKLRVMLYNYNDH